MTRRDRWGELFPLPLVGIVVLLVILIFLTPNLVPTSAPSAGSLQTQAELVVDHVDSEPNVTHLYVKSIGSVRFTNITLSIATWSKWPSPSIARLHWSWNLSMNYSLFATGVVGADPFAVNVTATYVDSAGVSVEYFGAYAFHYAGGNLVTVALLPDEGSTPDTPISALPLYLLLSHLPLRSVA